jgi:hypothetical protein
MNCRHCNTFLKHVFLDLGFAPPSNAYLNLDDLNKPEKYYPLKVKVCSQCWLVQTEDYQQADELFRHDYAYFSSTSKQWLAHAASYTHSITKLIQLTQKSFVIEIASNDGYLLKNFIASGIPCLGIEPTESTASAAEVLGIPVLREFFGESLGKQLAANHKQADLIVGNNVYAHVPDINDFTRGLKAALKPRGLITLEFPHLMSLIEHTQFDTVYHEHFSYLSLFTVMRIFEAAGLRIWHVEKLSTHGGSLRIFGCHAESDQIKTSAVDLLLLQEAKRGLQTLNTYLQFQTNANKVKDDLLCFLLEKKQAGQKVVAYGAAAKGNTLLNYAGVKPDLLEFVCDGANAKQGKFMPGSHIPILAPNALAECSPDFVFILPWNIAGELIDQIEELLNQKVKYVTAVPSLMIT